MTLLRMTLPYPETRPKPIPIPTSGTIVSRRRTGAIPPPRLDPGLAAMRRIDARARPGRRSGHQPIAMFDSMTLRAPSRSLPVCCM